MKIKFKSQAYQTAAVEAVVDCFEGQPNTAAQAYRIDPGVRAQMRSDEDGFRNADIAMPASQVLENIRKVQKRQNLPLSTPNPVGPAMGALMSYGSDFEATGRQAARLAQQIIQGTAPADLPVESPEFFLTINLQTANRIGLEVPDEVLRQADSIIR